MAKHEDMKTRRNADVVSVAEQKILWNPIGSALLEHRWREEKTEMK